MDTSGRVAVITGGASGIGRGIARAFAGAGMRLVLADLDDAMLASTVDELSAGGAEVIGQRCDVAQLESVEELASVALARFGAVHVLCNNAGVVKRAQTWALTEDDWRWVLDVDLWGVIHGVRAFVPRMLAQGQGGHIVNTASMAGLLPFSSLGAYCVAKSGVVALSEVLQLDLEAEGSDIGVSVLCPGFIATRITESGRNRPGSLADTADAPNVPRTSANVQPTMDADEVADEVVEAVKTSRFWILTHGAYGPVIEERAAGIGADGRPRPSPVW
jgi:NAD(P)-dependent dehydrogenase (short-subunit alcohol dehydrogenase family)